MALLVDWNTWSDQFGCTGNLLCANTAVALCPGCWGWWKRQCRGIGVNGHLNVHPKVVQSARPAGCFWLCGAAEQTGGFSVTMHAAEATGWPGPRWLLATSRESSWAVSRPPFPKRPASGTSRKEAPRKRVLDVSGLSSTSTGTPLRSDGGIRIRRGRLLRSGCAHGHQGARSRPRCRRRGAMWEAARKCLALVALLSEPADIHREHEPVSGWSCGGMDGACSSVESKDP